MLASYGGFASFELAVSTNSLFNSSTCLSSSAIRAACSALIASSSLIQASCSLIRASRCRSCLLSSGIVMPEGYALPKSQERSIAKMDRYQATCQVLTPIFDPGFSEWSFGFRPGRSAHGAIKQVQRLIRQRYAHVVNVDLSKFFDRIQHDVLMSFCCGKFRRRLW